ncbi:Helix-turn-helix domain-containing protein [Propionispira arboris]|uniref:Helix-turn-helix domain-containing protein n=1 Tax=Propionispira arboris TaxID=84035 RepID=A0A1H7D770_9FIRM|nr:MULTISPECIES: helix-turn-helix domain-containing protein [Propionispira]SEJ96697.1 Helix-turn-helix domain-containing protein [Propionispira arboris]
MTREDYIKSLIKSHGYNLKEFSTQIQMPYTTLLSILNGSIGGAAVDNMLKICYALHIKIEDLDQLETDAGMVTKNQDDEADIDAYLLKLIRDLSTEKRIALKILLTNM